MFGCTARGCDICNVLALMEKESRSKSRLRCRRAFFDSESCPLKLGKTREGVDSSGFEAFSSTGLDLSIGA